jgi:hypothetical protein
MTEQIAAAELEPGDKLLDVDGHGKSNPWGPDLTDKIAVKKRWGNTKSDRWDTDSWLLAPVVENGKISNESFAVAFETINKRLETGRYQPLDIEAHRTLDTDDLPVSPDNDIYIRFGEIPENERSYNHTDDRYEDGVSVYSAEIESVPPESSASAMFVPVGPKVLQILLLAQRDTYLVTGTEVGTGVDGEPLLQDVTLVAELDYTDTESGWTIAETYQVAES